MISRSLVPTLEDITVTVWVELSASTILLKPRGCGLSFLSRSQYLECHSASLLCYLETRADLPNRY